MALHLSKEEIMKSEAVPYHWFVEGFFSEPKLVRSFGLWQIWSANQYHACLLLVVNEIEEIVIKCQYESGMERAKDVDLLLHLPPEGDASAGMFALPKPVLPVLPAGNARPLPKSV